MDYTCQYKLYYNKLFYYNCFLNVKNKILKVPNNPNKIQNKHSIKFQKSIDNSKRMFYTYHHNSNIFYPVIQQEPVQVMQTVLAHL